jgi:glycosyltransferase involved in cell wall biosynthesis
MEHFGISTVEAMSAGAAPIVIKKGGQKEIMTGELVDWTWENPAELVTKTVELIHQPKLLLKIQQLAHQRAQTFNRATFSKILSQMIE